MAFPVCDVAAKRQLLKSQDEGYTVGRGMCPPSLSLSGALVVIVS